MLVYTYDRTDPCSLHVQLDGTAIAIESNAVGLHSTALVHTVKNMLIFVGTLAGGCGFYVLHPW